MSIKLTKWQNFSHKVEDHIEQYVIPQYGDEGVDLATDYSFEECIQNIKRYIARAGKNSRPHQDELDMIKIAHYSQMAYFKLQEKQHA
jgi:hypothetical protein